MSVPPDLILVLRQWIEKAEHDLINAEHTLKLKENCPLDTVCFHAQQCAEKYLKALLTFLSVPFPKTHDLLALVAIMPKRVELGIPLSEIALINRYASDVRYPGDWGGVTRNEAEEAVSFARKVQEPPAQRGLGRLNDGLTVGPLAIIAGLDKGLFPYCTTPDDFDDGGYEAGLVIGEEMMIARKLRQE